MGRGRSVKGRRDCEAVQNTLLWLLCQLVYNSTESSSCMEERLLQTNDVCDKVHLLSSRSQTLSCSAEGGSGNETKVHHAYDTRD